MNQNKGIDTQSELAQLVKRIHQIMLDKVPELNRLKEELAEMSKKHAKCKKKCTCGGDAVWQSKITEIINRINQLTPVLSLIEKNYPMVMELYKWGKVFGAYKDIQPFPELMN